MWVEGDLAERYGFELYITGWPRTSSSPKPDAVLPITTGQDRRAEFLLGTNCERVDASLIQRTLGCDNDRHTSRRMRESDCFLNSAVDDSPRKHDFRFQNKKCNDFKSAIF